MFGLACVDPRFSWRGSEWMACAPTREAVGVLRDELTLRATVDELLISGFEISDISVLAGRRSIERTFGYMYDDVTELVDDPETPFASFIDAASRTEARAAIVGVLFYVAALWAAYQVIASGGTLLSAAASAAVAGSVGALIGLFLVMILNRHHAAYVDEQLARGGLPVWIMASDQVREARACRILEHQAARDVHVHDVFHEVPRFLARAALGTEYRTTD